MHTLYRWEFSKIKNNMLTPMNAITEEELTPRKSLDGFIEPIAMKAGDNRVLVNGETVPVDFRIIAEELYQLLLSALPEIRK